MNDIQVNVSRFSREDASVQTAFEVDIRLIGDLSKREKVLLFNSARKCEVNKLLNGNFDFSYHLLEEETNSH